MGQTYEGNYLKLPVSETTNPTPCALKKTQKRVLHHQCHF